LIRNIEKKLQVYYNESKETDKIIQNYKLLFHLKSQENE